MLGLRENLFSAYYAKPEEMWRLVMTKLTRYCKLLEFGFCFVFRGCRTKGNGRESFRLPRLPAGLHKGTISGLGRSTILVHESIWHRPKLRSVVFSNCVVQYFEIVM